jgi:hypothetical protein
MEFRKKHYMDGFSLPFEKKSTFNLTDTKYHKRKDIFQQNLKKAIVACLARS